MDGVEGEDGGTWCGSGPPAPAPGGAGTLLAAARVVSLLLVALPWCGNAAVAAAGFCPSAGRGSYRCFCCAPRLSLPGLRQRVGVLVKESPDKVGNRRTAGSCGFVGSLLGSVSKTFSFLWCSAPGKISAKAKAQIR